MKCPFCGSNDEFTGSTHIRRCLGVDISTGNTNWTCICGTEMDGPNTIIRTTQITKHWAKCPFIRELRGYIGIGIPPQQALDMLLAERYDAAHETSNHRQSPQDA